MEPSKLLQGINYHKMGKDAVFAVIVFMISTLLWSSLNVIIDVDGLWMLFVLIFVCGSRNFT